MPRRYRPPTRRRKSKQQRLPAEGAEVLPYEGIETPAPPPTTARLAVEEERAAEPRHITRDYSYVMGELRRIAIIVAFIVAGLVITAILR